MEGTGPALPARPRTGPSSGRRTAAFGRPLHHRGLTTPTVWLRSKAALGDSSPAGKGTDVFKPRPGPVDRRVAGKPPNYSSGYVAIQADFSSRGVPLRPAHRGGSGRRGRAVEVSQVEAPSSRVLSTRVALRELQNGLPPIGLEPTRALIPCSTSLADAVTRSWRWPVGTAVASEDGDHWPTDGELSAEEGAGRRQARGTASGAHDRRTDVRAERAKPGLPAGQGRAGEPPSAVDEPVD